MATSQKQDKKCDMYIVNYWTPSILQGGPGRSEYVKVVLEEAGVPYKMQHENIPEKLVEGYPNLAVPLLQKGSFSLSQTSVICRYLGKKHGLYPCNEEDEWHADQLNSTVHDYIMEGRLAFHGKKWYASYLKQQEETKPYITYFTTERMPKFLKHFEQALGANNEGKGFMVGDTLTYVDLGLWTALRVTESQFNEDWKSLKPSLPLLAAFLERLSKRPRLKAYLESDRCLPFSGNSMM